MNIKNISTELQALTHSTNRSEASQMRDLLDDIESSIKAGVRQDIILQTLNFKMNLSSFRSTLKRLRKERLIKNDKEIPNTQQNTAENNLNETNSKQPTIFNTNTNLAGTHRPAPLLNEENGVWGKLKPSPADGTVDLKQK